MTNKHKRPGTLKQLLARVKSADTVDRELLKQAQEAIAADIRLHRTRSDRLGVEAGEALLRALLARMTEREPHDADIIELCRLQAEYAVVRLDIKGARRMLSAIAERLRDHEEQVTHALSRLFFHLDIYEADQSRNAGLVLRYASALDVKDFEADPQLIRLIVRAHMAESSRLNGTPEAAEHDQSAHFFYLTHLQFACPSDAFFFETFLHFLAKERFDETFDILTFTRPASDSQALRTLVALGSWLLILLHPVKPTRADAFDPNAPDIERIRSLLGLAALEKPDWASVRKHVRTVPEALRSPMEIYLSMLADIHLGCPKDAVKTGKTARERLGDDPIHAMLESRAHKSLDAMKPALSRIRAAYDLCRAANAGPFLAGEIVEDAFRLYLMHSLDTASLSKMNAWWATLPASWQTPSCCRSLAELELFMAEGYLKSAPAKRLFALMKRTPAEERDFDWHVLNTEIILHTLRTQRNPKRIIEAHQAIEAVERCLDPKDPHYDERFATLECLHETLGFIIDPAELLSDGLPNEDLPNELASLLITEALCEMMQTIGPQSEHMPLLEVDESPETTVDPALITRLEKAGVTIHSTYPIAEYGTAAVITTPNAPKHIAYLVTLDANEHRLAFAREMGLRTRKITRQGHEIGIAIPARETARPLDDQDWRLRLLYFILQQAEHDDTVCSPGFLITSENGLKLPSSEHNTVLLTSQSVLPDSAGIRMVEVLPLFEEELDYASLFSLEDLMDRLSNIAFYPPTPNRPNVCAGENWKTLIPPDNIKRLYHGLQPKACLVDPRVLTEGRDVRLFFRFVEDEKRSHWVFLTETDPGEDAVHCAKSTLNTVLNYLPYVGPYLEASPGSAFLRHDDGRIEPCDASDFVRVAETLDPGAPRILS